MAAQPFRVQLDQSALRRGAAMLTASNLFFTATTAAFIFLWGRFETLGPTGQFLTRHVLVHGHLATENVVAAWYSAMLLLAVAVLSILAFRADCIAGGRPLRAGWLGLSSVFLTLSFDEIGSLHERIGMIGALSPWGAPAGWVYVLAMPMLGIAAAMVAFAFSHLRHVHATQRLMAAGTVLFLLNPLLEAAEMRLIHGEGGGGGWQRQMHDVLLILEEGGLELFGVLCFIAAVAIYLRRTSPDGVTFTVSFLARWVGVAALCVGAFLTPRLVDALPGGDSGLPQHWFPAVAWVMVGAAAVPVSRLLAALAAAVSAAAGSGIHMYSQTMTSSAAWVVPVGATLLAGAALEVVLWSYRFSRSPRSSTASPTLRRPRPNPS